MMTRPLRARLRGLVSALREHGANLRRAKAAMRFAKGDDVENVSSSYRVVAGARRSRRGDRRTFANSSDGRRRLRKRDPNELT